MPSLERQKNVRMNALDKRGNSVAAKNKPDTGSWPIIDMSLARGQFTHHVISDGALLVLIVAAIAARPSCDMSVSFGPGIARDPNAGASSLPRFACALRDGRRDRAPVRVGPCVRFAIVPVDEVLKEIRAAQASAIFRQMPIALAVNIVNAAITAFIVRGQAGLTLPLTWFFFVLLVTTARWISWRHYRRARPSAEDAGHWSLLATAGSLLAGLSWGIGGRVLFLVVSALGHTFFSV